jgi:hypothetical protein
MIGDKVVDEIFSGETTFLVCFLPKGDVVVSQLDCHAASKIVGH